jgi:PHD and RING finger domain-containing protein 1
VDNKDEKFALKKKIIYKKLKRSVRRKRRSGRRANRSVEMAEGGDAELNRKRIDAGIPRLSIMGNPNALDYFSDDDEEMADTTASGPTAVQSMGQRFRQTNALRRRQAVKLGFEANQSNPLDLLDTIMESQQRWHSKNGLKNVKIRSNGALVFDQGETGTTEATSDTNTDRNSTEQVQSTEANSSTVTSSSVLEQSTSEAEVSTSTGDHQLAGQSGGDGNDEPTGDCDNNKADDLGDQDKSKEKRKSTEEEEDCPNFSIYSAETLGMVNAGDEAKNRSLDEEELEKDVDLVQLGGDDEEEADQLVQDIEKNQEPINEAVEEENRSYTPCLDEIHHHQDRKDQSGGEGAPAGECNE